mmetsp:Transcript_149622/g.480291  ORF Transcript_149622/g.480291 Transcript_149622/m.480291 type:complete len:336 (-) Transcript_149622:450-1457(-)
MLGGTQLSPQGLELGAVGRGRGLHGVDPVRGLGQFLACNSQPSSQVRRRCLGPARLVRRFGQAMPMILVLSLDRRRELRSEPLGLLLPLLRLDPQQGLGVAALGAHALEVVLDVAAHRLVRDVGVVQSLEELLRLLQCLVLVGQVAALLPGLRQLLTQALALLLQRLHLALPRRGGAPELEELPAQRGGLGREPVMLLVQQHRRPRRRARTGGEAAGARVEGNEAECGGGLARADPARRTRRPRRERPGGGHGRLHAAEQRPIGLLKLLDVELLLPKCIALVGLAPSVARHDPRGADSGSRRRGRRSAPAHWPGLVRPSASAATGAAIALRTECT